MKNPFERKTAGSLAASIAIHILVVAALVQIAFRYPLGQLIGLADKDETPERIQFVKVPPQPTENSGGGHKATPVQNAAPPEFNSPLGQTMVPD